MGLWFPSVLLGQVLTRMGWNLCSSTTKRPNSLLSAFKILLGITLVWYVGAAAWQGIYYEYGEVGSSAYSDEFAYGEHTATLGLNENASGLIWILYIIGSIITYGGALLIVLVTCRARRNLREQYEIPARCGLEDACCAVVCSPCSICQMARHTADYDVYKASFCRETGLGVDAPAIV